MKKHLLKAIAFSLAFVSSDIAFTQDHVCGTTKRIKEIYASDPLLEKEHKDFIEHCFGGSYAATRAGLVYTIPVVFHIIHEYGTENISDAQVINQVAILNEDFRKLNADTSLVIPEFDSLIADAHINFRLATLDPDGNCTNGINHYYSHETRIGDDFSKTHLWPRNKYLNIWVVKKMESGIAGYAYYPSATAGMLAFADGIIILNQHIGNIGTGTPDNSRSLTHEVGHYLNLPHTWGSNNDNNVACGNDGIPDTPETAGSPIEICDLALAECNAGIIENVQNYMDYSYCSVMFTPGQALVMEATLNSNISYRDNLWQSENLTETGTDVAVAPLCSPVADCNPDNKFICLGDAVTFADHSWRAVVSSYAWTFPGGTSTMLTSANPLVTYNTPGWHDVTMTVTNAAGSDTKTFINAVYVSNSYTDFIGPAVENFESAATEPWWVVDNPEINEAKWSRINLATAASGSNCFVLNNHKDISTGDFTYFDKLGGSMDALISPSYDLSSTTAAALTFKYSYATHATVPADQTEELKIYVSIDCGKTWSLRKTIDKVALANAGVASGSYSPLNSSASYWKTESINLGASVVQPNVRFKFEFTASDKSNNLYIDDINVNGVVGLNEMPTVPFSFDVYPNPVNSGQNIIVEFTNETGVMNIELYNSIGAVVYSKSIKSSGNTVKFEIPVSEIQISGGIYVVSLSNEVYKQAKRIVVD